ncbi:MAG: hypothetical protein NTZ09_00050, partial [Candidatus Hydrogenedentes bacterium]|nr:hypothetical protein [Candidatus Hydrogenedentota bacterium]
SGACLRTLRGHTDPVNSVGFRPDGARIVSGSGGVVQGLRDNTVRVWDAHSGTCLRILQGHTDSVTSASFSADGARIVSGSGVSLWGPGDNTVRVWDTHSGACLEVIRGRGDVGAIAAGAAVHPFRALRREPGEIVIEETASGTPVGWFAASPAALTTHPAESIWAGSDHNYVYLMRLERDSHKRSGASESATP